MIWVDGTELEQVDLLNAEIGDALNPTEDERLVGKMREDGVTDEEQRFVMEEIGKPMDTDAIVRAVPNQQAAAQIYTASYRRESTPIHR